MPSSQPHLGEWVIFLLKLFLWNVRLARNASAFRDSYYAYTTVLCKSIHMFLLWLNAMLEAKKTKWEGPTTSAKHSLKFLSSQAGLGEDVTFE